jgi:hypothetical protein
MRGAAGVRRYATAPLYAALNCRGKDIRAYYGNGCRDSGEPVRDYRGAGGCRERATERIVVIPGSREGLSWCWGICQVAALDGKGVSQGCARTVRGRQSYYGKGRRSAWHYTNGQVRPARCLRRITFFEGDGGFVGGRGNFCSQKFPLPPTKILQITQLSAPVPGGAG